MINYSLWCFTMIFPDLGTTVTFPAPTTRISPQPSDVMMRNWDWTPGPSPVSGRQLTMARERLAVGGGTGPVVTLATRSRVTEVAVCWSWLGLSVARRALVVPRSPRPTSLTQSWTYRAECENTTGSVLESVDSVTVVLIMVPSYHRHSYTHQ